MHGKPGQSSAPCEDSATAGATWVGCRALRSLEKDVTLSLSPLPLPQHVPVSSPSLCSQQ